MNTALFNNGSFYEFEDVNEYYQDICSYKGCDMIGFLKANDMIEFEQVKNNESYIITIIKEDNGQHEAFFVNGLELKINYLTFNNMAHGGLNIWNVSSFKEDVTELI